MKWTSSTRLLSGNKRQPFSGAPCSLTAGSSSGSAIGQTLHEKLALQEWKIEVRESDRRLDLVCIGSVYPISSVQRRLRVFIRFFVTQVGASATQG